MNFTNKFLPIEQAKAIDMVGYLDKLGFEPLKIVRDDYWYRSPFREERTASFKINRALNRWYDHGLGKGGSLIDFGMLYFKCSFGDFLKEHCQNVSASDALSLPYRGPVLKDSKIRIIKEQDLSAPSLLGYLKKRKIPIRIAAEYCREVSYSINDNSYYGIGFKNDLGGFEIRNPYFKASSSPKGITSYGYNSKEVLVFEGFMDFLSFKAIQGPDVDKQDFIILNSLSFLEKTRPVLERYPLVRLYLDRDQAGEEHTMRAIGWGTQYKDQSSLYQGYKDLNEWAAGSGRLDQKLNSHLKL